MKKTIFISEEQEKYLNENKGLLFEYYEQISNPRGDTKILGDLQIWIYGNDRQDFTPHCHIMTKDKSTEFEVSIINWNIINVKNGKPTKDMKDRFFRWLNSNSTKFNGMKNKNVLFATWDGNNPNNDLLTFMSEHSISAEDDDLAEYLDSQLKLEGNED